MTHNETLGYTVTLYKDEILQYFDCYGTCEMFINFIAGRVGLELKYLTRNEKYLEFYLRRTGK